MLCRQPDLACLGVYGEWDIVGARECVSEYVASISVSCRDRRADLGSPGRTLGNRALGRLTLVERWGCVWPDGEPEDIGGGALVSRIIGGLGGERMHAWRELRHVETPSAPRVGIDGAYVGVPIEERDNRIRNGRAPQYWSGVICGRVHLWAMVILVAADDRLGRRLGIDYGGKEFGASADVARSVCGRGSKPVVPVLELSGDEAPGAGFIRTRRPETRAVAEDLDVTLSFRPARQCQCYVVGGVVIEQPRIVIEPDYDGLVRGSGVDGQGKGVGTVADIALVIGGRCGETVGAIRQRVLEGEAPGAVSIGVRIA